MIIKIAQQYIFIVHLGHNFQVSVDDSIEGLYKKNPEIKNLVNGKQKNQLEILNELNDINDYFSIV